MRKRKLILWDTFYVELRGPREFEKDRTTNRHVNQLRAAFAEVVRRYLKRTPEEIGGVEEIPHEG